ncbi:hypothetical protein GA0070624_3879 [Micromonospora rhizosphaerae]|uniref:Uncharacterized protein n=1 Tax=Micromonospora rhizosphaerae TaxID=568872 RepID=A0A1C6SIQ6_9ACTN|nr:hypothetical protein [Micromonospora rhizosphaerae]SCL29420.1 hypothetical protein GA0070624_3879 [Micromonospora rhizosphaerae]
MRHDTDDDLLARLRSIAAEVDPVPDAVRRAAHVALDTRDLDGQLARLVADSAATSPGLAYEPVRRADPVDDRFLTFDGSGLRIELEVTGAADGLTLIGQVIGARPGECVLEHGDGRRDVLRPDAVGRFVLDRVSPGPIRLRCRSLADEPVTTTWVNL